MQMSKPKREIRLTKRDYAILAHIAEFRMTTFEFLHNRFFADKHPDAVKSCIRRLSLSHIKSEPLDGKRVYYKLTDSGARAVDVPVARARRLGQQARIERYALQWFIAGTSVRRKLIDPRKIPTLFDVGSDRLPKANFYIEASEEVGPTVGYVVVDHGAHPRRTAQKVLKKVQRFLKKGWCNEYMSVGRFTLTVLTPSERSKRMLERQVAPYLLKILKTEFTAFSVPKNTLPFKVTVELVPQLDQLLLSPRTARSPQKKAQQ